MRCQSSPFPVFKGGEASSYAQGLQSDEAFYPLRPGKPLIQNTRHLPNPQISDVGDEVPVLSLSSLAAPRQIRAVKDPQGLLTESIDEGCGR